MNKFFRKLISLGLAFAIMLTACPNAVFSAQNGTYINDLTDQYDVNSDENLYGLDCDSYPMLCQPIVSGDFIQKWYCDYWTENDWTAYFNKLTEAKIPMVIIQSTATVKNGKFTDIGFEPDNDVSANISDSCTGNRNMLSTMLKAAKRSGIQVMIGLTTNDEWWDTNNNQLRSWYTTEADLVNMTAKCIYDNYYDSYSDVICGWYWPYEMWTCNSYNDTHLENSFADMLNLTLDYLDTLDNSLPVMVCPFISKYYYTENASICWKKFFENVHFRDGDIIAPQDCLTTCGYDLATVEAHIKAMSDARKYCNADVQFWIDVENYDSGSVANFIKQLRICSKYATRLIAFSYAHYYAQESQSDLHSAYVEYANSVMAQSSKSSDTIYEAEDATISGTGVNIVSDSSASGGKAVGEFSSNRSQLTFNISVEKDGYYNIIVNSKGIGSDKINYLSLNGTKIGEFSSKLDTYSEYKLSHVFISKGSNTLKVTKSWGYIYLDYIKIASDDLDLDAKYTVSKKLNNPNATDSAKRLMSFFCDNYGKNVISGQTCDKGYNGSEFTAIQKATGKTPAILGMDLMDYTPCRVANGTTCYTVEYAQQFNDAGGIVEIYWHWNAPDKYLKTGTDDSGNPRWWQGFYTKNVNIDLDKIMNGQDQVGYDLLVADIDAIAVQLKRLQTADVPVLFRPLHEASGGWFWWGAKGADAYKKLWKLMYTRLTDYHGLNNLIWVWNGQSASWYPGDEYCDMMGEDIYPGTHEYSPQSAKFLEVSDYSDTNKIVALSENGCLFDIDKAISAGTLWSWFCVWGGSFCANNATISTQYTELNMWKKVYQHENVITLDELPDLKSYPLGDDELPEISGTPEIASINLTLTGVIGANVYYNIPDGYINDHYDVKAVFSYGNSPIAKVSLDKTKTAIFNNKTAYMFTLPVKSCDMESEYTVSLQITKTSDGTKAASTRSTAFVLNDYIKSFGATSDTKKQTFANAMQTYGYYSQKMFNTTDELPNIQPIDLSDITYSTVQDYEADIKPFRGTKKASLGSSSLYLDSGTGIKTYITDIDTGVNKSNLYMWYTVNGVTNKVKVVQDLSGKYYGEIPDVPADKLSAMYNIAFYEGNTQITDTAIYGAYSYIYSTLNSTTSADIQNLVKALYKYSVATDNMLA